MPNAESRGPTSDLIRYRFNNKCHETPNGEWKWRVLLEEGSGFKEILCKRLEVLVISFSKEDVLPDVGHKCHMAAYGSFRVDENGTGVIA